MIRYRIAVSGIVQGVGFRPFVYREATRRRLAGYVQNTGSGVSIEVEGEPSACDALYRALTDNAPPLSRVSAVFRREIPVSGGSGFVILPSQRGEKSALVSPDIGICADCARELFDPADRRYRYPFINCTNCGPRFSIVEDIPYDRANTSMRAFLQCPRCQREYDNPRNRRFHAQPNACAICGPALSFLAGGEAQSGDPIDLFTNAIRAGSIVAVKGLGGFHLACDARNESAVSLLRARKRRYEKPFAVMLRDLEEVKLYCALSPEEEALLASPRKPIVLLRENGPARLAPSVAPGNRRLGVMLPYTPLHCLLMERTSALVLTSGNVSDRPMLYRDAEAANGFSALADAVLTHNRPIVRRVDDSVFSVSLGSPRPLRRARGWAPEPIPLPGARRPLIALGAQQKNTLCLVRDGQAFLSSHIGDLDDPDTEREWIAEIRSQKRLFSIEPEIAVCDLHPDYVTTRFAREMDLPILFVQHHRAHFASVLAEHNAKGAAIGFIWDGTGYGDDGTVWGGETLFGTIPQSARVGHLLPFFLPGGEAAVREPWRAALSTCDIALGREEALHLFPERAGESALLLAAADAGIHTPQTTSMGRLFDAIAALAGLRETVSYEGQAAVELEQCADEEEKSEYRFMLSRDSGGWVYDWRPVAQAVMRDRRAGVSAGRISMRFHRALAQLLGDAADAHRHETGCDTLALSGGCFQNELLLALGADELRARGFHVLINRLVPCNDGGISYGQAAIAATAK